MQLRIPTANDEWLDSVPELPRPAQRWTVRRKATVIQAVRGGWIPIEEVGELYNISVDEFIAWEREQPERYEYAGGVMADQGAHVFDGIHMLMAAGCGPPGRRSSVDQNFTRKS